MVRLHSSFQCHLLILLVGFAAACGEPAGSNAGLRKPMAQDSAGVRIVENGAAPATRWHVGEPVLTVGWRADDPTFTWPQSGRISRDGGVLVGDFGAGTIYQIESDGLVSRAWGRKGEGPGEYQALDAILLRGDSIVVSDSRLQRLTLLARDGGVETRPLPGSFLHQASAILADGRVLLIPGEGYSGVAETRPEWVFETQPILAVSLDDGAVDTLAVLPHLRRWYGARGASPGPVQVKGRAGGFVGGFAWARSDLPEVRWYDGSGRLVQIARWEEERTPLTSEWRRQMTQAYEDAYRSRGAEESFVKAQLAELRDGLDRYDGPLPLWSELHVDRLGNVWLSEYGIPGDGLDRWRVLTRDGTFAGWVDMRDIVAVLDITDGRVLAVRLNEVDVPAFVVLEVTKP